MSMSDTYPCEKSEADGKPWKCDVGYDSLSKQWTWITYPLDGDSQA